MDVQNKLEIYAASVKYDAVVFWRGSMRVT